MDTVPAKRCENCVSHEAGPTPRTGTCRNLAWQPDSGAIRFVRDWELACYGGWGTHHWSPRSGGSPNGGGGSQIPGAGGGGTGNRVNPFRPLTGSPVVPLIPIELLAEMDVDPGLDPDPRDHTVFE